MYPDSIAEKLRWSLPWLLPYPVWRACEWASRVNKSPTPAHLNFLVANHFEPSMGNGGLVQLERWCKLVRDTRSPSLLSSADGLLGIDAPAETSVFIAAEARRLHLGRSTTDIDRS